MGLVSQVFTETALAPLEGMAAIGHTRYSTTGASQFRNAQPLVIEDPEGPMALGHNGNVVNAAEIRTGWSKTASVSTHPPTPKSLANTCSRKPAPGVSASPL